MVPFAGYEMPVQYAGVIAESKAVRQSVGMFDVSHMARLTFTGQRTVAFLEWVTTNDVSALADGAGQYSLLPNAEGGVVDDVVLYRIKATEVRMVVNAVNREKDIEWLAQNNGHGVTITDQTDETAMVAVQGPKAAEVLCALTPDAARLREAPAFGVVETSFAGVPAFAGRSGYTGEDGFELICEAGEAERLWTALLDAGAVPCGLGARDVLRVEAGLPLYGQDLNGTLSPIAAGLGWVVHKTREFIGAGPIARAREEGTPRRLVGVRLDSKRVPAPGMNVLVDGKVVGQVSSGVFSPLLDRGVAFAYVDREVKLETPCALDMRGKEEPGVVVNKRFYRRA
jgi:aminomethyltransferase